MAATACNEHIAKIAALPRVDKKKCIFAVIARVDKVLESSNFGNMPPRYMPYGYSALCKRDLRRILTEPQKIKKNEN